MEGLTLVTPSGAIRKLGSLYEGAQERGGGGGCGCGEVDDDSLLRAGMGWLRLVGSLE